MANTNSHTKPCMFTAPDTQCIRSHKLKLPKDIRTQKAQTVPTHLMGCGERREAAGKINLNYRAAKKQHALLDEQLGGNFPRLERHTDCVSVHSQM